MEIEDYEDENKTHTFGTINDLKESFCSWLDNVVDVEGDKKSSYKIEDGKLTLRVYDTYVSSQNGSGGKTYQIIVEKEKEVLN
tara:strand:- start:25 stop:273 length:249 start_codon:yes stop_codon:yes gene_type:complete